MRPPRVIGSDDDLALAGYDGDPAESVVVTLREPRRPADGLWVHWSAGSSAPAPDPPDRLIAPAGDDLWRRAPWPVNDSLFELPPADPGDGILVAAAGDDIVRALRERGFEASAAEHLTPDALRGAAVVVLGSPQVNLAAEAMAVLAAQRVLVSGPCELAFGLISGIEFLRADTPEEAAMLASIAVEHWRAFDTMRILGRFAAERHRASVVYERLVADLELEGAL